MRNAIVGCGVFFLFAAAAHATIIGFDDTPADAFGVPIPNGYAGLNWSNFGALNGPDAYSADSTNGYTNGVVSPDNVAFDVFGLQATASGSPFTFNSAYFTAAWNNGLSVTVTAYNGATQVGQQTFVVDATGPTLETFNFVNIDKVTFDCSGGTNAGYRGGGAVRDGQHANQFPRTRAGEPGPAHSCQPRRPVASTAASVCCKPIESLPPIALTLTRHRNRITCPPSFLIGPAFIRRPAPLPCARGGEREHHARSLPGMRGGAGNAEVAMLNAERRGTGVT